MKTNFIMTFVILVMISMANICLGNNVVNGTYIKSGSKVNIVISENSSTQIRESAVFLSKYLNLSLGLHTSISQNEIADSINIYIGETTYTSKAILGLVLKASDGFVIDTTSNNKFFIIGGSDWGTEFGVYDFLERYLGIKWLMPGQIGEYVPKHNNIIITNQRVVISPDIKSRAISGVPNLIQGTWARYNRNHGHVAFHHNLSNLFPPEKYVVSHPEFFPIIKGKRYLPKPGDKTMWQPCFSEPGLVNEAANNIINYFKSNPQSSTYSLGINDSPFFCECEKCAAINKNKNSLGYNNVSESYFTWANAVVEKVLKVYPGKMFGCLAYHQLSEPAEGVHVHPNIVPFITSDRMKWIDLNEKNDGIRITENWKKHANNIGWYDYVYGTPYMIPRIYSATMKDYISYASNNNIYAYYGEAYPNWGEGPKLYILMKLLWDSKLDQNRLLEDWCVAAVGVDASKDLITYYRIWESIWMKAKKTDWFTSNKREILNFNLPEYLNIVNERDVTQLRSLITSVNKLASTDEQKERANILLRAFEYYEASLISYFNRNNNDLSKKKLLNDKRTKLLNGFESDILLKHPLRYDKWKTLNW